MEKLKPDATGIYVAAHQAPGAIEEAIEAEVPLIVAVAEHIPIHNMLRVCSKHLPNRQELKVQDPLHAEVPIEISARGSQLTWDYICCWQV